MTEVIWNSAFNLLMENEGGFVNNPKDPGGATNRGVTQKSYNAWRRKRGLPVQSVELMTIEETRQFYREEYWLRAKCDRYPDCFSVAVFDYAVNSGVNKAVKDFQKALGVVADGIVGNQTIGAANRLPPRPVLKAYMDGRLDFLMSLKTWKHFGNGWGKRVKKVQNFCEGLI